MIDKATVDLIIDSADIVDVVSDFVTLRKRGANYVGLCPFHNDRTPSFYVSKSKGICKCFSCGEGGSALNFIMKHEQMNYHDALIYLANKYHIEVNEREQTDEEKAAQTARDAMFMLNEWACQFFETQLHDTTEGQEVGLSYFNDRGFSTATIKKFRLGYSPEDRSALYKAAVAQGFNRQLLFDTGLCVDDNRGGGYDRYRGRVIFPIVNVGGKIVAFGGRTLKKDKTIAKYVNSPESIIYSKRKEIYGLFQAKREINKHDKCYIVEGYADVISMHQSGFENVIASSGTALTDEHIHMIHRFTENVTEMFDGDEAGIKAALKGIDKILAQGLNMKVLLLPDDDDPDSYSRKHSASEIQQYIDDNEADFITFKTGIMLKGTERDPIKRAKAIEDVTKSIAVIPSEVTRAIYAKEVSDMFNIGEDVVLRDVAKYIRQNREERAKNREREKLREERQATAEAQQPAGQQPDTPQPEAEVPPSTPPATSVPVINQDTFLQERALIKYIIRYGMCNFCTFFYQGEELVSQNMTVVEYIQSELEADKMLFNSPHFKKIYDLSISLLDDFYNELSTQEAAIAQSSAEQIDLLMREIDPIGHSADSLRQEEERIKSKVNKDNIDKINEYRTNYLEKRLFSHPDDEVRRISADLASEKYTLSKIHTEYATIPTEFDKLESLVPSAIFNWKNAIVQQHIKQVQQQLNTASPDEATELLKQLQHLYAVRSHIAKYIGERVVNPK